MAHPASDLGSHAEVDLPKGHGGSDIDLDDIVGGPVPYIDEEDMMPNAGYMVRFEGMDGAESDIDEDEERHLAEDNDSDLDALGEADDDPDLYVPEVVGDVDGIYWASGVDSFENATPGFDPSVEGGWQDQGPRIHISSPDAPQKTPQYQYVFLLMFVYICRGVPRRRCLCKPAVGTKDQDRVSTIFRRAPKQETPASQEDFDAFETLQSSRQRCGRGGIPVAQNPIS